MTVRLLSPWAGQAIGSLYSGSDEGYLLGVGKASVEIGGGQVHINRDGAQTVRPGDATRIISATNATATTIRVATPFFATAPVGIIATVRKDGAGNVTIVADDGTVIGTLTTAGATAVVRKLDGGTVAIDGGAQVAMPAVVYPTGSAAGGSGGGTNPGSPGGGTNAVIARLKAAAASALSSNPIDAPVWSATAVTITEGTGNGPISGQVISYSASPSLFRVTGGVPLLGFYTGDAIQGVWSGAARMPAADNINTASNVSSTGGPNKAAPFFRATTSRWYFRTNAAALNLRVKGSGTTSGAWRLSINDGSGFRMVSKTPNAFAGGTTRYIGVQHGDGTGTGAGLLANELTYCLEMSNASGFFGPNLPTGATLSAPTDTPVYASYIGDSFFQGSAGSGAGGGISNIGGMAETAAWKGGLTPQIAGVGGTAYLATNGGAALKYRDRIDDLDTHPFDVVFAGSPFNDLASAPADVANEALLEWQAIRAKRPSALIVAVGCWTPPKSDAAATLALAQAMEDAISAKLAAWGDPMARMMPVARATPLWMDASNFATWVNQTDLVHPTIPVGHDGMAGRFDAAYRTILASF